MRFILALFFLLASFFSYAQPVRNFSVASKPEDAGFSSQRLTRLDQVINQHITDQYIPGAVVLLIRNGKVGYFKSYGYSDVETKTPLRKDDIFRAASLTKVVTSLAVMMLWEEGKFLLDDPISRYIPEFKKPTVLKSFNPKDSSYTTEPASREITIRHLLTHSSGLDYPYFGSQELSAIYIKAGIPDGLVDTPIILGDKIKKLGKLPLKNHPGEKWNYGLSIDVLGYLVEVTSGMSLDAFFKTRIFEPLGMKDTYFYLPKEKHARLVSLYHGREIKINKVNGPSDQDMDPAYPKTAGTYFSGGAGLSSTIEDYAKFLQLFLNGGEFNGARLVGRKAIALMITDQHIKETTPFGFGLALEVESNDHLSPCTIGSFSGAGLFNTHYWADPKENLIGLIFMNFYQSPYWHLGDKFKVLTYQSLN